MIPKLSLILLGLTTMLCSPCGAQTLKVMSYNIHHGTNKEEANTLKGMGDFIKSTQADLVGLQEVDSLCNRSGKVDQMKQLAEMTGMHYSFVRHFAYDGGAYGLGILSRYPLSDVRNDRISSTTKEGEEKSLALLSAKVDLPDGREILFATVHFALDQPTRLLQATETIGFIKRDFPVILTGDMNAGPDTKEIDRLLTYFTATQSSEAYTFPVNAPIKKIDYIMVNSQDLNKVIRSKVMNEVLHSDHLPIISEIYIADH